MTVDLAHLTPWASLAGGVLIGLAASLFVLGDGRIAGIAGIVGAAMHRGGRAASLAFLAGLLAAPWAWRLFAPLPAAQADVGVLGLVGAGLLVGVGVRLGNGCTSGHGVCGLARRSLRSAVNVIAFMTAGIGVVFVLRHLGLAP